MEPIPQKHYLDQLYRVFGKDLIIVLVGERRVGKSFLLRMLRDRILEQPDAHVIFVDKEKKEYDSIRTYTDLNAYIDTHLDAEKRNFILIDEVQEINEFERSVRSYYEEENVEIVVTGSNSDMLSGELSSRLGGRYKEIYVQALSYEEFLEFHALPDTDASLSLYLQLGALPGLRKMGLEEAEARSYQMDVYHTVLLKDVVMRHSVRNVPFLENLVRFLADNTGKVISANSIARYMKSQGESVTSTMVNNYIKALCDAYILHRVNRYDIHGRRLFETNDKYYFEDHGMRNALAGGGREGDIEKVIENVVYNHLRRLGYSVWVGQLQKAEIDFVCQKPTGQRIYVQVAFLIADEATREREFGNLHAIKDNYPKYVISMTPLLAHADDNGVTHLHLRRFLTEGL